MNLKKSKAVLAVAAVAALTASLALFGCSSNEASSASSAASSSAASTSEDKTIVVAASPTPHAEILTNAVAPLLEKEGYTLEVKEFADYVLPNNVTEEGEVDANYFQHVPYLESFNEENGTHLVSVTGIHYEPFGLYAGKTASLADLPDGAKVAIPNDTTNEARALLLLEQEGLIKLADGAGVTATPKDVVENPKNLEFVELEAATVPRALADVDIAAINSNYAIEAGLSVANDALAVEDPDGDAAQTYVNVLVVKDGNQNSEKIKALAAALNSDEVRDYINDTFDGAVLPIF